MKWTKAQIDDFINAIHAGIIDVHNLPKNLYKQIAKYLIDGVDKGFKEFDSKDADLLQQLRENVYMFSSAKTYQQVKDIAGKITTDDGTLRPFNEFKKDATQIFDEYNVNYLRTEYNTAIGQAAMASKWDIIQAQKDILPYLQYSTIGDACDICAPLDGFTAPVDDPAWDVIMPLNHFNCECLVNQVDETDGKEVDDSGNDELVKTVSGKMDDTFKMNPGKDGYIFSPDHPYFVVPKDDRGFAKDNFGLPFSTK